MEVLGTEGEMAKRTLSSFPDRKISETFLQFAEPLLQDLPSEARERRARDALQVSFTAWNAVIFADVLNDDRYLNEIRLLTAYKPETALLVEQMIARMALPGPMRLLDTRAVRDSYRRPLATLGRT